MNKQNKTTHLFIIMIIFLMMELISSCASTKADWRKTLEADTIPSYQNFIAKHPKSEFVMKAKEKIEILEWQKSIEINTIEGYAEFINRYPQSDFVKEAKNRIENIEWQKTTKANTTLNYEQFISKYPESEFAVDAKEKINFLLWKQVLEENTISAYNEYLGKYPDTHFKKEALNKIDNIFEVEWERVLKADEVISYVNFIKHYNDFSYASDYMRRAMENLYSKAAEDRSTKTTKSIPILEEGVYGLINKKTFNMPMLMNFSDYSVICKPQSPLAGFTISQAEKNVELLIFSDYSDPLQFKIENTNNPDSPLKYIKGKGVVVRLDINEDRVENMWGFKVK